LFFLRLLASRKKVGILIVASRHQLNLSYPMTGAWFSMSGAHFTGRADRMSGVVHSLPRKEKQPNVTQEDDAAETREVGEDTNHCNLARTAIW
jgi:hypothetical protein